MCHKYRFQKKNSVSFEEGSGLGEIQKRRNLKEDNLRSENRRMSTYNFIQFATCSKLVLINKTVLILIITMCSLSITFYICKLYATASLLLTIRTFDLFITNLVIHYLLD